jgi:hypothetical protein
MQIAGFSGKKGTFMDSATRWLPAAVASLAFCLLLPNPVSAQEPPPPKKETTPAVPVPVEEGEIDIQQIREELGINEFTAPSIEHLLAELMDLRPVPLEKVWKDPARDTPQERALIALSAGRVIADGLLAVIAEKPSRLTPCAQALMRYAKGLGVADHVSKHSKSVIEKAARESWGDVRRELVRAQADVEAGMMALKDEEIAHLVSLGGWIRGLDVVATLIEDDYSPERARRVVQPEALEYFIDRIATLNPRLKSNEIFQKIEKNLKEIQALIGKADQQPPSKEDLKKVRELAGSIVEQL